MEADIVRDVVLEARPWPISDVVLEARPWPISDVVLEARPWPILWPWPWPWDLWYWPRRPRPWELQCCTDNFFCITLKLNINLYVINNKYICAKGIKFYFYPILSDVQLQSLISAVPIWLKALGLGLGIGSYGLGLEGPGLFLGLDGWGLGLDGWGLCVDLGLEGWGLGVGLDFKI